MSFQVTLAKWLLKLPPNWLVKLAGGSPLTIGERTLDAQFQFLVHGAKRQPALHTLTPEAGQAATREGLAMFAAEPDPTVSIEDLQIEAPGRNIPARLYRPAQQDPDRPLMVYMHMGGGVVGDLDTCHAFCAMLAAGVSVPVLSIDYRLAPQHKFPAGLDDCIFAYEWALRNAERFGCPPAQAAVGGDSMGGNFSAIIAQEMAREAKPVPFLQLLIYPATDIESDHPSRTLYGDIYPLEKATMDWFMTHYLPEGQDLGDVRLSPAQETDLGDLPPAIIATAGFDVLVDEGEAYARQLETAGGSAEYVCYDSLAHGFTAFTDVVAEADRACRDIVARVDRYYAKHAGKPE